MRTLYSPYDKRANPALALVLVLIFYVILGFLVVQNAIRYPILLVGAGICCVALFKPRMAILALFGILPFVYFFKRLEFFFYRDPTSEYNNPVSLIPELIIIALLLSTLFYNALRKRFLVPKDKFSRLLIIFLMLTFLQIFNPRSAIGVGLYGFRLFGFYILVYFLGLQWGEDIQYLKFVFRFITIVSFIVSLYGVLQYVLAFPIWDRVWVNEFLSHAPLSWARGSVFSFSELRSWSTLHSPQAASNYFAICLVFAFVWLKQLKSPIYKLIMLSIMLIIAAAMVLTATRGGWVGAIVALVVINALVVTTRIVKKRSKMFVTLFLILFVAVAVGWLAIHFSAPVLVRLGGTGERLASLSDPLNSPQLKGRFVAWDIIISRADFLGQGIGTTGTGGTRFVSEFSLRASDNVYLKVLYELGIIGVVVFVILIFASLRLAWQTYFLAPNDKAIWLVLGLFGVIIVVIVSGFVIPVLEFNIVAIIFWFCLGALRRLNMEFSSTSMRAITGEKDFIRQSMC